MTTQHLAHLSDEDLTTELERRRQERRKILDDAIAKKRQKILSAITKEVVDALRPEHARSSCNDDNLMNGWRSNGGAYYTRCTRCALLEVAGGFLPDGWTVSLSIKTDSELIATDP